MLESCIHLAVAYPATSEPTQIHIVSGCDYLKPTLMARPISATALVALYLGFWGLFAAAIVARILGSRPYGGPSTGQADRTSGPQDDANPIDRFITAKLSESGLKPSPASAAALHCSPRLFRRD